MDSDCSIWHECWRSSMDRSKFPGAKGWFSECHVGMCRYACPCTTLFPFPSSLYADSCCLARKENSWKKLVTEQEVVAQETVKNRRYGERGLPSDLMVMQCLLHFVHPTSEHSSYTILTSLF